jgi:S-adenosylmethionine synthetase
MLKSVEVPLMGHPDKVCDQIADAILDEYLRRDPKSRVELTVLGAQGMVMIGGSVDSRADFDAAEIAKQVYKKIGYEDDIEPFVNIERPQEGLARTIIGGGAQGTCVVHGYATKETREFLPRSLVYAQALAQRIDNLRRHDSAYGWLRPDGKVQLTMDGDKIISATILVEHIRDMENKYIQLHLTEGAIEPILGSPENYQLLVNPAGAFHQGGFAAKAGASGRKSHVDLYGGLLPFGGASLAGRDPLHPNRCGTYLARLAAKSLVSQGVAGNVLISVGYTVGLAEPTFIEARTGSGEDVSKIVKEQFDFRPEAIVERLNLRQPLYEASSAYGPFGRIGFPWEETAL